MKPPVSDALVTRAPVVGVTVLLVAMSTITIADSDLWGHLRFGLDTLLTRTLPPIDPYSFTQDRPWINHEWLSELVMALAWTVGGTPGLALLKGALVAIALFLVWHALRRTDLGPRIVIFAVVAVSTTPLARTLRPQLWTLLFLAGLCRVLVDRRVRARRWLPVLFALWANIHGGWIVGLGVLAAWTATDAEVSRRIDVWQLATVISSIGATLLTPYGWRLWLFLADTVRMGRDITEWQPLWNVPPIDAVPWLVTVAVVIWLARYAPYDRWPRVAVLVMLAYASARVVRIAPLFVACAGVLLADAFAVRWPRRSGTRAVDSSPHEPLAAAVIAVGTIAAAFWVGTTSLRCIGVETPRAADGAAMPLLRGAPSGRLVTFFDWGEYAIWHLGPTLRVSMDGRRETLYSDARLDEHAAILESRPDGFATLAGWQPEYVWLPVTSTRTREWLVGQGYRIEHANDRSFVAVRPDLPALPRVPGRGAGELACFPG